MALVLIYGSATLAVLFWIGLAIDEISDWEKYKSYSYAYSFEQGYEFLDGEEISCALNFNFGGRLPTLPPSFSQHCGDQAEIIRKYNDFVRSVLLTDEIKNKCANVSQAENTTGRRYVPISERDYTTDECQMLLYSTETIKPGLNLFFEVSQSLFSSDQRTFLRNSYEELQNLKAKRNLEGVHYSEVITVILQLILIIMLTIITWIVFWESIIYRTILYIIYGKTVNN